MDNETLEKAYTLRREIDNLQLASDTICDVGFSLYDFLQDHSDVVTENAREVFRAAILADLTPRLETLKKQFSDL